MKTSKFTHVAAALAVALLVSSVPLAAQTQ